MQSIKRQKGNHKFPFITIVRIESHFNLLSSLAPPHVIVAGELTRTLDGIVENVYHLLHGFQGTLDVEAVRMARISML